MALKDKPVDLEDLKALKDWIVGRMDMWDDITSSLTWSNATWVPIYDPNNGYKTSDYPITFQGVKVTKLSVAGGETYKITEWIKNIFTTTEGQTSYQTVEGIPFVLTDSSDAIISVGPDDLHKTVDNSMKWFGMPHYTEFIARIPASAKYMYIFDFAGHRDCGRTVGEVIVKKAL